MKILITGGTGFIGRHLCRRLQAEHALFVLSRRAGSAPPGTELIVADATQAGEWQERVPEMDAVINLAGESIAGRWTAAKKQRLIDSRVRVTDNLVQAMGATGRRKQVLLSASGAGFYGVGEEAFDEDSPAGQGFLADLAQGWERPTLGAEAAGLRVCRMRLGVVLGAEGGALPKMVRPFRLGLGGRIGSGQQWLSWIHIDDAVAAMEFLLQAPEQEGAFNLCAPQAVRNGEFGEVLARQLRRRSWLPAPTVALRLALGEFASTVLEGQRVLPRRLQAAGFEFRYPGLEAALASLLD